ncbi:NHL repeat-containing protein [Mucilaginibacter lacusdianchii]|uniref:NHL repeat-containing protein n=1 Tax=Mucilaginibacter lacusdianchii TaxID=2684211 RepID=UPI00131CDC42|nr:hypothetical protein [Mucilaginibacter sp. JXJ CY 39]
MKKYYAVTAGLLTYFGFALISCNKDNNEKVTPTIETNNVIAYVTATTAQAGGVVTELGSSVPTVSGVCWSSTNQNPTVTDSHTSDETNVYVFAANITGLTANTTYYVRAYTQSNAGVAYGDVLTFTTSNTSADTTATVSTFAGNGSEGFVNGTGDNASFYQPQGVAADAQGNLYVADAFNHVIRKVTPAGVVSTFAGSGTLGFAAGSATQAQFHSPMGIVVDAAGNVYVSDEGDNAIFKITQTGTVSILAGNGTAGYANGEGSVAQFNAPQGIAVDASGNVYVADKNNNVIRKITSTGVVSLFAGIGTANFVNGDAATVAKFNQPTGVAVDATGVVYVADQGNHAIRKISGGTVSTFAGNNTLNTLINNPSNIAIDSQGNMFITDQSGRILEISKQYILYTLAGKANTNGFADGTDGAAQFNVPKGIAVDLSGKIYVADTQNNRIRRISIAIK